MFNSITNKFKHKKVSNYKKYSNICDKDETEFKIYVEKCDKEGKLDLLHNMYNFYWYQKNGMKKFDNFLKILINSGVDINSYHKLDIFKKDKSFPKTHILNNIILLQRILSGKNVINIMEILLQNGVDINSKNTNGDTILMFYIKYYGHVDTQVTIECLVSHGAKINQQSNNGNTALIIAANVGNINAVKTLLDLGANRDIQNYNGETAIVRTYDKIKSCYAYDEPNDNFVKCINVLKVDYDT